MYIDWPQIKRLPSVDTLIDIGVGPKGTHTLVTVFQFQNYLYRPLDETELAASRILKNADYMFFKYIRGFFIIFFY